MEIQKKVAKLKIQKTLKKKKMLQELKIIVIVKMVMKRRYQQNIKL